MNTDFIKGVIVPIITPIDVDEKIDEKKLRDQVDYVIDEGVLGVLAFGSNGEFYMIEEDEMERGLKIMLDQAKGSVPETPMLLYNNPGRAGYTLSADLVTELAHSVKNIVGIKDTSGDITLTSEFIRRNRDVNFKVFGGKDTLLYASLCHGAVGGVCTAANFMPELITDIYYKFVAGDMKGALEAQFKLNPVRLSMDRGSFPVAAKDMAKLRGRDMGKPYLPSLPTPEGPALEAYRSTMREAGLIQ